MHSAQLGECAPNGRTALVTLVWILVISWGTPNAVLAQHNDDPFFFQGLSEPSASGVKAQAMGNAFVARSNDLQALFFNPAGLADIRSVQVSFSALYRDRLVRDNQDFYPGSGYVGTSLYLEHLLIPDPAWNNIWDDSLRTIIYDSTGNPIGNNWWDPDQIRYPVQGADDYSAEAAENENSASGFVFDHIALAYPFEIMGYKIVAAAAYTRQYDIDDYDWNGARLDPHWGSADLIEAASGDIVRSNWDVYTRSRRGGLYGITGALALEISDHLSVGARLNWLSGKTSDLLTLDRVGYFRFKHGASQSRWSFSYETRVERTEGTSEFSALDGTLGLFVRTSRFDIGASVQLPYTIERTWSYAVTVVDTSGTSTSALAGTDEVGLPAKYALGVTFRPNDDLKLSFAYERNPLSAATYRLSGGLLDTLRYYERWVDQVALRFGLEYALTDEISILAGYQSQGASFVGYGVAVRDAGEPVETYSGGLSLGIFMGRLDIAYTYSRLKYYDVYMTNRNFTLWQSQRLSAGYTIIF